MESIKINAGGFLKGEAKIPSSKSIGHRALICASLSEGISRITNVDLSRDIFATCEVLRNLGVQISIDDNEITVKGSGKIVYSGEELFCDESGSTLRFLIPLALLQGNEVAFNGRGKLVERPLTPYYDIFTDKGIKFRNNMSQLPLALEGRLIPGNYRIPGGVSSQFISGLLFALPLLEGNSLLEIEGVLESKPYIDLTLDTLKAFGININNNNYRTFEISGNQKYRARNYSVEGDYSQAAFFIAAGVMNGFIRCSNLNPVSLQGDKAVIEIVKAMGGDIDILGDKLIVKKSNLKAVNIDASQIPDLVPILTVLAAVSQGETLIYNASRLRIKECDRLKAIAAELNKIGAHIIEETDSLRIEGV
ncbi:MAG: 3-phosphoshikimate 1-carboxyvinyltransferase, partial [Bacillota bacterium]|nr:3-phosphoshikimate 1-carboxyvinyltransferase [Bacillota bacterium]